MADLERLTAPAEDLPLASAEDFRIKMSRGFPGLDWSDTSWGVWRGDDGSMEINLGKEDPVHVVTLHVRADPAIAARILGVTDPEGWTAFDTMSGGFLPSPPLVD